MILLKELIMFEVLAASSETASDFRSPFPHSGQVARMSEPMSEIKIASLCPAMTRPFQWHALQCWRNGARARAMEFLLVVMGGRSSNEFNFTNFCDSYRRLILG